jgi:hypothetical protein
MLMGFINQQTSLGGTILYGPTNSYVDGFIGPTNSDFDGFMARATVFFDGFIS